MELLIQIGFGALAAASLVTVIYFSVALGRIRRALRSVPRAGAGVEMAPPEDELPSVCVIVPAHNEARVIEKVVASILKQDYPRWRAVVALDRCTDDTKAIVERVAAGDARVEIIEIDQCPEDWAGKTNALRIGVRDSGGAAESELLLFVDADTELHPLCLRAAVGLMTARDLDLVSFLSTLSREHWFEHIVQPMAVLELMREHPLERVNRAERPASFANGQFMLFRKSSYQKLGGHERVKEALLEDIAFARALKSDGGRWGVFIAGEMLRCRMYGDWGAFRRGWKRIFIESTYRRPKRLRQYATLIRSAYALMPTVSLVAAVGGGVGVLAAPSSWAWGACIAGVTGLALWLIAIARICSSQGASFASALLSPIGAWMVGGILRGAAEDLEQNRGVSWGGRVYTDLMNQPTPGVTSRA